MISNPAMPHPAMGPRQFTLNDLRVRSYVTGEKSSSSALAVPGMVLVAALALGAFVMLDPLALFAPPEPKAAAPAFVPPTEPARPAAMKEIITPQPNVPATKYIEEPAVTAPVVQAPQVPAPAARQRAGGITPESRTSRKNKADITALRATPGERPAPPIVLTRPEEKAAPPVLLTKPEEKTDAPIVPNRGDAIKDAPKPAAANDQPPVKEEVN